MNTNLWYSLYLISDGISKAAIAQALLAAATADGYRAYDPFGLIPSKSYPHTLRSFVSVPRAGWVRVLADAPLPPTWEQALTLGVVGVSVCIGAPDPRQSVRIYADGAPAPDPLATLTPYLQASAAAPELARALQHSDMTLHAPADAAESLLPIDVLPTDLQDMAGKLNMGAANKMFGKLLGGKVSAEQEDAARALINQNKGVDWNAPDAARVRLLLRLLNLPADAHLPDFVSLRDAYSLHTRRQRNPNARLYPGDAESMAQVPNALDYSPVYAGKD